MSNEIIPVDDLPANGLIKGFATKRQPLKFVVTEEMLEKIKLMAQQFYSDSQMAIELGIRAQSFRERKKIDDRIQLAIDQGSLAVYKMASRVIVSRASKGDLKAATLILTKKFKWGETSTLNVINATENNPDLIPKKLSDDPIEASKVYQKLMG